MLCLQYIPKQQNKAHETANAKSKLPSQFR